MNFTYFQRHDTVSILRDSGDYIISKIKKHKTVIMSCKNINKYRKFVKRHGIK